MAYNRSQKIELFEESTQTTQENMVQIRLATPSEIAWINECYDQVRFIHSDFERELIAIAEVQEKKAGIGRLVTVDAKHLELGGIYVFQAFRNRGIARGIVTFLLQFSRPHQTIYCIPFEHLIPFYEEFGFTKCSSFDAVPEEIVKKYLGCKEAYAEPTALMVLEGSS